MITIFSRPLPPDVSSVKILLSTLFNSFKFSFKTITVSRYCDAKLNTEENDKKMSFSQNKSFHSFESTPVGLSTHHFKNILSLCEE